MDDVAKKTHNILLTGEQAAEFLELPRATFWRRKDEGKLPPTVRKGKREMFRLGDLIEFEEERKK